MDNSGQQALLLLDKLLAERPERVGHDFSEATRYITAYRDELIATWRRSDSQDDRQRLRKVNSIISVILGGHYPLGSIPWSHLEKSRTDLASIVG